ncbi:MAG: hypothetical protein A3C50_00410 [Candidatus Staskawiczbacteria bacterium RIFCSPHIGHO2_02_FULL_43_16]|uniref:R3H domain-containing protein n=1 Tax=Candidatus Staskawiczbacteria bacterium RIFCSPHIGHO2_01_FULL_41_41 TaxID=1802203 RepID=A0A1G2HVE1_9BACT|nr:MAG: hypothetical protein A2822_02075 [Candidatus Staskawiczbacteria bacterium RIFCSPHIGHO2_01_FULL_41_41]OGZ68947.1 MAG: hypothetical protein A3C50_00410 [Candidatus Staskawiczbacteria bacterium RIFCSPHIGHO2_02_FULL_43_16]OGZ74871.1 MAG: hypothetical protein A3A12_03405 [Candidatus Staskawiczbacteria bacterium RIFCSPLOWO2_01_FULL_43_17b]
MITKEELEIIKGLTQELLTNMTVDGFTLDVVEGVAADETVDSAQVRVTLSEPQFLIGENGKTLLDLQRTLRMLATKKLGRACHILLDINNYQAQKLAYLKKTANELADQVSLTKISKTLPPMSSYERRIIHAELAGRDDVATESQGEGLDRRVVITPK